MAKKKATCGKCAEPAPYLCDECLGPFCGGHLIFVEEPDNRSAMCTDCSEYNSFWGGLLKNENRRRTVWISDRLWDKIVDAGKRDGRTASSWLRHQIEIALKQSQDDMAGVRR